MSGTGRTYPGFKVTGCRTKDSSDLILTKRAIPQRYVARDSSVVVVVLVLQDRGQNSLAKFERGAETLRLLAPIGWLSPRDTLPNDCLVT